MKQWSALICAVLLLVAAIPAVAQETTSSIQGTAMDQSGAALPGVTVEAVNERGQRYSTTSDSTGHYRLPSVSPGIYTVTGTLSGMEAANVKNLQIVLGASPKVDLKLGVGAVKEAMTITADAPVVDTTQSAKSTSIRSEQFERLPKGRDFTTVVTQAAGANQETRAAGISIDGATGLENRFVVDGVDTTEPRLGTSAKRVITDNVDEVQVKSSGYEAEYGGATGGVINVITKSGTNDFSGQVNSYLRDSSWNGSERPSLQQNASATGPEYVTFRKDDNRILEPGAALGGPIVKDRLWFFGSYQPTKQRIERTVTFLTPQTFPATNTFKQDVDQDNILANINGNLGAKAIFKLSGNITGGETKTPSLPSRSGRDAADPSLYAGKKDVSDNSTYSGYFDFIPTQSLYLSARGGHLDTNFKNKGVAATPWKQFYRGSNSVFADTPPDAVRAAGFTTGPQSRATDFDKFQRDNYSLEGSYFANFLGSHSFKTGVQNNEVKNSVLSGSLAPEYRFQWNRNDRFLGAKGKYGAVAVFLFQTTGDVKSDNLSYFLQDSWSMLNNRLTLNLGVRTEHEKVPNYGPAGGNAIDWGWGDKVAPRLGFSYDVTGNGRAKIYGSYGKFYDIMKLALARGSWGGDKWLWHAFTLETPDWRQFNCTGVSNDHGTHPTCTNGSYIGTIDLREPTTDFIDPDIKPMTSQEFTIGGQQEIGNQTAVGVRYVHKSLLRAIEDLGTFVQSGPNTFAESYSIGNPGFGQTTVPACATCPGYPKAKRDYDGMEFEFTRRFNHRWGLHATYLFSRLYGNYAGLANPDEGTGIDPRVEPNVSRWGDFIETVFTAKGGAASAKSNEGRLPTDRPHQLKAQLSYQFPIGTTLGVNQYVGSGTPISTVMYVHAAEFYPNGRGDLGRTPWLKQTDLFVAHRFPFAKYGFEVNVNVLNLFDSKTTTAIYPIASQDSVAEGGAAFFAGFNALKELKSNGGSLNDDVLYKQASAFQFARELRLQFKFTF